MAYADVSRGHHPAVLLSWAYKDLEPEWFQGDIGMLNVCVQLWDSSRLGEAIGIIRQWS